MYNSKGGSRTEIMDEHKIFTIYFEFIAIRKEVGSVTVKIKACNDHFFLVMTILIVEQ